MNKLIVMMLFVFLLENVVWADIVQGIEMDFVTIGNVGNDADTNGHGSLDYEYRIGKYEVTNSQWNSFTSLAGTPMGNPSMAYNASAYFTGSDVPTNNVSWFEAAQFCNYLTSGDNSRGAYQFSNGDFTGIDRDSAISDYGTAYVIPTEDEWYKAAYYTGSGYSLYSNGLNTITDADNGWNYDGGLYSIPWDVGTGSQEQNGTFDMMGNVWELNETDIYGSSRVRRGGGCYSYDLEVALSAIGGHFTSPQNESQDVGFRVASVPEPGTLALLSVGILSMRRKRKP